MESRANAFHSRSTSLPSTSHPSFIKVEECLHLINDCSTSSLSKRSSDQGLCGSGLSHLQDLYHSANGFLRQPLTQQAICRSDNSMHQLSENLLVLVDVCAMIKDSLPNMMEHYQCFSSLIRRQSLDESIAKYTCARKMVKKDMKKCLSLLRCLKKQATDQKQLGDHEVHKVLYSSLSYAIQELQILATAIHGGKQTSNITMQIPNFFKLKKVKGLEKEDIESDEIQRIDACLHDIQMKGLNKADTRLENIEKELQMVLIFLRQAEDDLVVLARSMMNTRVCLLNIVTGC